MFSFSKKKYFFRPIRSKINVTVFYISCIQKSLNICFSLKKNGWTQWAEFYGGHTCVACE